MYKLVLHCIRRSHSNYGEKWYGKRADHAGLRLNGLFWAYSPENAIPLKYNEAMFIRQATRKVLIESGVHKTYDVTVEKY